LNLIDSSPERENFWKNCREVAKSHAEQLKNKVRSIESLLERLEACNFILRRHRCPENDYEPLLKIAKERDIGTIVMKAFARGPWPTEHSGEKRPYSTWYEPFESQTDIDKCLWFALSQEVTTAASACDAHLVPKIIDAAERYRELKTEEQRELIETTGNLKPLFPRNG